MILLLLNSTRFQVGGSYPSLELRGKDAKPKYFAGPSTTGVEFEFTEAVYDKSSRDSAINWGYSGGLPADTVISGKDFSKYKKLNIYVQGDSCGDMFVCDLEHSNTSGRYWGYGVVDVSTSGSTNVVSICTINVKTDKTGFDLYMYNYPNTPSLTYSDGRVVKIEGVY
mgnify:CR=1 FL=1